MTQLGFYFDQTRCTGCFTCAVACRDWHDIQETAINWMQVKSVEKGKFPNLFVAYLASPCYHCQNAACIQACPTDAICKRESDGIITVDAETCLGRSECPERCLKACPWDSPQFGPEENAKMQKCNLCLERLAQELQPICVEACPLYALDVGPFDRIKAKYGDQVEAEGFCYFKRFKPAVTFKPKKQCESK